MPATNCNAVSERSFSALKQVTETYLRSTTGDSRLNHLIVLHVHKDRTDALRWGERKSKAIVCQIFRERYPRQVLYSSKSTQTEIRDKNKRSKKYALTEGPSHFMLATSPYHVSWWIKVWLLTWLVNYVAMLLVVCQLSRDVIGYEDS